MRKFLSLSLAVTGTFFVATLFSTLTMQWGDILFRQDTLFEAHTLYNLSHTLNPLNTSVENRLAAVDMQLYDRTHPNEESAEIPKTVAQVITPTHVLGVSSCVPVLMYHYIRVNPWPTDTVGFGLSTPPFAFKEQLEYFKNQGYQTITLSELKDYLIYAKAVDASRKNKYVKLPSRPSSLPTKPLIITLDDGYEDAYTQGFPLLKEVGMKAVEFVITGFVGLPNYLTWDEIKEMQDSGVVDMQSHTVHHYALGGTFWSLEVMQNELLQSKKDLESHVGKNVEWLAYPYGSVSDTAAKEAAKIYYAAFGTNF